MNIRSERAAGLPFSSTLLARWSPLLAAAAGALSVLSFAPFGWWPLQILSLALLFSLLTAQSRARKSALLAWAYSAAWMLCGVYWLYISMHRYGGLPAWMAGLGVVLFALVTGGFAAIMMGAAQWLRQRHHDGAGPARTLLLLFPACWMLGEWLRGWVFTGFPWIVSGYAHTASPLAGYAPLVGVYGVGWLAALAAGSIALLPRRKLPAAAMLAMAGAGLALHQVEWTRPHGAEVSVRLLQGNVPQEIKFAPEQVDATLRLYHDMVRAAPADLIATPETALPLMAHRIPPAFLDSLRAFLAGTGSRLALGIPISDGPMQYANSVLAFPADPAAPPYRYDKHHLVPFGEFIPPGARWFVEMMNIPLGDFTRSPLLQPPFALRDQWVMPNICYEDLFGEEIAAQIAARHAAGQPVPTLLLNLSNIAWFGDSIALPQHLQISQMRALETGRPMLRATNTGATAVIDSKGRVAARLPYGERGALEARVQGTSGLTPYVALGNALPVGLVLLLLALFCLPRRKKAAGGAY
mgnify:CR=1 FL=1